MRRAVQLSAFGLGLGAVLFLGAAAFAGDGSDALPTYTHKVLAEEATATWCSWCPYVMDVLHAEYQSGLYDFQYISLVDDMNTYAAGRNTELGVTGFPTVFYDGAYSQLVGWQGSSTPYNNALNSAGARVVKNIDITLDVAWTGSATMRVTAHVTNHETIAYSGHLHAYVTEINSRWWNNYNGSHQYHFAMIGNYALNQTITVPAGGTNTYTANWNGNSYGMGDIVRTNIMVVVPIFRTGTNMVDDVATAVPAPVGACCQLDGTCTVTTQAACTGVWHGEWTACVPNNCPQSMGACCSTDGVCAAHTEADCSATGGLFHGLGTVCAPCMCATCVGDANCDGEINFDDINPWVNALVNNLGCNLDNCDCNCNGLVNFDDINPFVALLTSGVCPMGACCTSDDSCELLPQAACTGVWHGEWTTCDPNPCLVP